MNRYARQIRLIGQEAQSRLSSETVSLGGSGLAREIEHRYLVAAGVSIGEGEAASVDVDSLGLRHAAARDVGEGALRALVAMRRILD